MENNFEITQEAVQKLFGGEEAPENTTEVNETETVETEETTETETQEDTAEVVAEETQETTEAQDTPEEEDSSLKDLKGDSTIEPLEEEETPETSNDGEDEVVDVDEYISDFTEGKFSSIEDLVEAATSSQTTDLQISDRMRKLIELDNKGVDILNVLSFQSTGYDKLDPTSVNDAKQLVMLGMMQENPDMDAEEAEYRLSKEYDLDPDNYVDDKEYKFVQKDFMRKAKKVQEQLTEKAKSFEVPAMNTQTDNTPDPELIKEQEALAKQWNESVNKSLDGFEKLDFNVGKHKFTYKLDNTESIKGVMSNPNDFLNRYIENGQANVDKFRNEMAILNNYEQLVKSAFAQGLSMGSKNTIESIDNITTGNSKGSSTPTDHKSMAQQAADAWRKMNNL